MQRRHFLLVLAVCLVLWTVLFINGSLKEDRHSYEAWQRDFPTLGTLSSPRAADLTGDGVLDVVIGTGRNRFQASDTAVLALDGRNGALLWTLGATDQLFGTAAFMDISGDHVPEVIIGGRRAELLAVDGASGKLLWHYRTQDTVINPTGYARFNFYQPQFVPDQSGDGLPDLLIANGGNELAAANVRELRYPGVLLILDSSNGRVIAADTMPDGGETYMSALVCNFDGADEKDILFGTGGETFGGSLYRARLKDLRNNDLSRAKQLASAADGGFVAPPVLADLSGDGNADIVAVAFSGAVWAIDGRTNELIWRLDIPDVEIYSSPAVGKFTGDEVPDLFFTGFRKHPQEDAGAVQLFVDGATGTVLRADESGCSGMSSPVAYDLDGDGLDEVLLSVNSFNCRHPNYQKAVHSLALYDPETGMNKDFYRLRYAKNVATTPWLGDMDSDGMLDIVFVESANTDDFYHFRGITLRRLSTDIPWHGNPSWGAYMGSQGDGVYRSSKRQLLTK